MNDPSYLTLVFRFFAGRKLWGERRTNRTFLKRGTKQLHPNDRPPPRWEYWPEWWSLAIRLSLVTFTLASLIYGLTMTVSFTGCCAALVGATKSRRLYDTLRTDAKVVRPLWAGLLAMGVYDPQAKSVDYLTLPPDYKRNKKTIVLLRLPDHFEGTADSKKRVAGYVKRKLGGEWDARWTDVGTPVLRLAHTPQPPKSFPFSDALRIIKGLKEGQLFIGLGARGEPIIIDLDKETPHVALSVGTGGGKSSTLALIIIQILAWGAYVFGIDPKRISLNPVKHLPGITIIRDIESQWDEIARFRAEMERRYEVLDRDESASFARWVLIIEESNTFYLDSVDYWETIRQRGEPAKPRVYRDMNAILNKGRQCQMNVISVFQRAEAAVCGGGAARSQYGYFLLGRYKKAEWKMFVDIWPWLAPSREAGRMSYYDGENYGTVQVAYPMVAGIKTPTLLEEATRYVLNTRPASMPLVAELPTPRGGDGTELVNATASLRPVTLRQAVDSGYVTGNLGTIQKASQRNTFPKPVDKEGVSYRYSVADLVEWEASRTAQGVKIS